MQTAENKEFVAAVEKFKKLRARFDQRQVLKHEFELLVRFEEETYDLWGLYQQAVVGNVNVPKLDYFDPMEESWMWGWIKGNMKWHAWNRCKASVSIEDTVKERDILTINGFRFKAFIVGAECVQPNEEVTRLTKQEAMRAYIEGVRSLEERLPNLIEDWKDDQDPRIPDRNRYVPIDDREEMGRITVAAKAARRERDKVKREEEEAMGMWDE